MCSYCFLDYYFIFGFALVAIVELRRMNARSIVGAKDVFLSYAHINIGLAKKVKVGTRIAVHCIASLLAFVVHTHYTECFDCC